MLQIEELKKNYKKILELIGEDVNREGLLKTPERVAKAMLTLTRGYEEDQWKVERLISIFPYYLLLFPWMPDHLVPDTLCLYLLRLIRRELRYFHRWKIRVARLRSPEAPKN